MNLLLSEGLSWITGHMIHDLQGWADGLGLFHHLPAL